MRAQRFIESARMPSLVWAARPLASGAPFAVIERRCLSSVEVGCPSFGGQRTDSGGSSRLLASLVTGSNRQLTATGVGVFGSGLSSQTARSAAVSTCGSTSDACWVVVGLCHAKLAVLGRRPNSKAKPAASCAAETAEYQSQLQQPQASLRVGAQSRSARQIPESKRASSGATLAPNPSVKGTSCAKAQAAPYVER